MELDFFCYLAYMGNLCFHQKHNLCLYEEVLNLYQELLKLIL